MAFSRRRRGLPYGDPRSSALSGSRQLIRGGSYVGSTRGLSCTKDPATRRRRTASAARRATADPTCSGSPGSSPVAATVQPPLCLAAAPRPDGDASGASKQKPLRHMKPLEHAPAAHGLAQTKCTSSVETQLRDWHLPSSSHAVPSPKPATEVASPPSLSTAVLSETSASPWTGATTAVAPASLAA